MKHRVLLLGAAGVALLSSCCHREPSVIKPGAGHGKHYHQGRMLSGSGRRLLSVPGRVHVYDVGRLPSRDGRSITEAGKWYHLEQSAYGNRFVPGSHAVINMGPTEQIVARAYRPVPNDPQLNELRNEALHEKMRVTDALGQIQLAKEKLGIATQNAQKTNEIIAEAMNKVRALHEENEALKRQLETHKAKEPSPDPDFSKFEQTTPTHPSGLAPGPVQ